MPFKETKLVVSLLSPFIKDRVPGELSAIKSDFTDISKTRFIWMEIGQNIRQGLCNPQPAGFQWRFRGCSPPQGEGEANVWNLRLSRLGGLLKEQVDGFLWPWADGRKDGELSEAEGTVHRALAGESRDLDSSSDFAPNPPVTQTSSSSRTLVSHLGCWGNSSTLSTPWGYS